MATSNSKPTQVFFATFITFFLLLLNKVNSLNDLSFSFNKFVPNQMDLVKAFDTSFTSSGVLRLTKLEKTSCGRARYAAPVQIWDRSTDREASFTTSFSFIVKALNPTKNPADGLAFYLAQNEYPIYGQGGYNLALFTGQDYNSSQQVVAVEFDTDPNTLFDPTYRHIGIDVNSIKSIKTVEWKWRDGQVANVFINYLAPTKTLIASLTYPSNQESYTVFATIDLKAVLPEWVIVGFSACTTCYNDIDVQTHDVLSWGLGSSLG